MATALAGLTGIMTVLFELGARPSVAFSLVVFLAAALAALFFLRLRGLPLLCLYFLGLYMLPFVNLTDYVVHPAEYF